MGGGKGSSPGGGYAGRRFVMEGGGTASRPEGGGNFSSPPTGPSGSGGGAAASGGGAAASAGTNAVLGADSGRFGTTGTGRLSDKQMADIMGGAAKYGSYGIVSPTTTLIGAAYGAWDRYNKQQEEMSQKGRFGKPTIGARPGGYKSLLSDDDYGYGGSDGLGGLGSNTSSDFGDRNSEPGGRGGV